MTTSTEKFLATLLVIMTVFACVCYGMLFMEKQKDLEHQEALIMKCKLYAVFGQEFDGDDFEQELNYNQITINRY